MNMNRKLALRACNVLNRYYSTKPKKIVDIVDEYKDKLENDIIKPRKHPGKLNSSPISFPNGVNEAIRKYVVDTPMKALVKESQELVNYLKCRHPPPENWYIQEKRNRIYNEILEKKKIDVSSKSPEEIQEIEKKNAQKIQKILKERIYSWKSITYDQYMSLKYLIGRSGAEYAVLRKVFDEIKHRVDNFTPKTYFDFGSGVGTGLWALTDCWETRMQEYVTVDISEDMNDVARNLFLSAYKNFNIPSQILFQRRHLSAASPLYDIVLCAYSLFEMPSTMDRLRTILNLWKKTKHFLVIVEHGTNAGFSLINEARDFILETSSKMDAGYVFAPCPHDNPCPRFSKDNTPCNFLAPYLDMKFQPRKTIQTETYSYVILHKDSRDDKESWPRIVRPTLLRSRHAICRMCCSNGQLQEIIFTKSRHGTTTYRCVKASGWGDLLPITIKEQTLDSENEASIENEQLEK